MLRFAKLKISHQCQNSLVQMAEGALKCYEIYDFLGQGGCYVVKMDSGQARTKWRELLDEAYARHNDGVIIERYNKPIAVLVNYDQWQTLVRQRNEFLDAQAAEVAAGNFMTHEQILADLRQRGTID
jgi:hypothetical protein